MMKKSKKNLILAIKGILSIYIPVIFLLLIIYQLILKKDMFFYWNGMIFHFFLVGLWTIRIYSEETIEKDIEDFNSVISLIKEGKWEIIEQDENKLIVKPQFDFIFRKLINDNVEINYSEQKATIKGPWYYANNMVKDIS